MNNEYRCEDKEIDEIIHSISLEEKSIANLLNAEGQKIQRALECTSDVDEIICLNNSVSNTVQDITSLEIVLLNKLKAVLPKNECVKQRKTNCCCCDIWCLICFFFLL